SQRYRTARVWSGNAHGRGVVSPRRVCSATGVYLRQCGAEFRVWLADTDVGLCAGESFPDQRENQFPIPGGSIQRAKQGKPWHAEPLCKHAAVWNDHHGDDARARNPVERQSFVLKHQKKRCCEAMLCLECSLLLFY